MPIEGCGKAWDGIMGGRRFGITKIGWIGCGRLALEGGRERDVVAEEELRFGWICEGWDELEAQSTEFGGRADQSFSFEGDDDDDEAVDWET